MGVCSLNHDTATSYRLGHSPFPTKSTPTWTHITAIMMHPCAHPQHLKVLKHFVYIQYGGCGMQSMGVCSLNHDTATSNTGRENLHHMVITAEGLYIIIGYHCEVTAYSFQLDKELHIVYLNTLKVGYTSKAHWFTSQIVIQMQVTSPVTNKNENSLLMHPTGTSG